MEHADLKHFASKSIIWFRKFQGKFCDTKIHRYYFYWLLSLAILL